jgi:hypothetical protein
MLCRVSRNSDDDDALLRATDHVLVACKESVKAVLRGHFQLLSQVANGTAGALIHFIHEEHYHVTRRERLRSESTAGSLDADGPGVGGHRNFFFFFFFFF